MKSTPAKRERRVGASSETSTAYIKQWDVGYTELLSHSTPADRRHYLSLCIMYKISHCAVHFHQNIFVPKSADNYVTVIQ